ncbi:MAG: hypothetical protein Q3980_16170 [Turicibacter sp.]|nr:hypothetical protein [Turicibacter sp.]
MWVIHLFFFTLGICLMVLGVGMIFLNWVPHKTARLNELCEQYDHPIDEEELCQFEGGYRIILGIFLTIAGIVLPYHHNPLLIYLIILGCFILFYRPLQYLYFNP